MEWSGHQDRTAEQDVWLASFAERGWPAFLDRMGQVVAGKREVIRLAGLAMLSGGHILMEDVPGVGKTLLARALARTAGGSFRRIQMTPDMMPADITGSMVWEPASGGLRYSEGALFGNVVLADELNRAPARTQSALLEAMEEGTVTVDGTTRALPQPFFVIATQNPLAFEGTYRIPEAEMDRFAMRLSLGYPAAEQEADMLLHQQEESPLARVKPLWTPEEWQLLVRRIRQVHLDAALCKYMADIAHATRAHAAVKLGISPRATLSLMRVAQAHAWTEGRTYALPEDVKSVAHPVLAHRLHLQREALLAGTTEADVVAEVLRTTPVPVFPAGQTGGGRAAANSSLREERRIPAADAAPMVQVPLAGDGTAQPAAGRFRFGGWFR